MTTNLLQHVAVCPISPASVPWIEATFWHQIRNLRGKPWPLARLESEAFSRLLRGKIASAALLTPVDYPEDFLGWVAALDGQVLYAYVRASLRRKGLGAALITAITDAAPVEVAYWTPDAQSMAVHGWPISYSASAYHALLSFARPMAA